MISNNMKALLGLSAGAFVALAIVLLVSSNAGSYIGARYSPTPTPTFDADAEWNACYDRCSSKYETCENNIESCPEQLFEDGTGNCYDESGDFGSCIQLHWKHIGCIQKRYEAEQACLQADMDCSTRCDIAFDPDNNVPPDEMPSDSI